MRTNRTTKTNDGGWLQKKASVAFLHLTRLVNLVLILTKYFSNCQRLSKLCNRKEFVWSSYERKVQGCRTLKSKETRDVILAYDTSLGSCPYTKPKYYQNIYKPLTAMLLINSASKLIKGDNYRRKKMRFISHARDTLTNPDLTPTIYCQKSQRAQDLWGVQECDEC